MDSPDRIAKRLTRIGAYAAARAYSLYTQRRWRHPGTSITDTPRYRDFCARAAQDKSFARFRADPICRLFIENNNSDEGRYYLQAMLDGAPHYKNFLDKFRTNDKFGGGGAFVYGKNGRFAPTTLRYAKYLSDCERHFGALDSRRVVEIGGGYGGLCKLFFDRFDLARYYLVDLPETLALARRYLCATLGEETVIGKIIFVNAKDNAALTRHLKMDFFDLAVSTLAFSECAREMQKTYIDFVFNKSTYGYLVMNALSGAFGIDSHSDAEVQGRLFKTVEAEEDPGWWWDDRVTIWTWKPERIGL
ncbi:MAG: putative sugar O-methyltransferase [Elusimicrobiota bacterium]